MAQETDAQPFAALLDSTTTAAQSPPPSPATPPQSAPGSAAAWQTSSSDWGSAAAATTSSNATTTAAPANASSTSAATAGNRGNSVSAESNHAGAKAANGSNEMPTVSSSSEPAAKTASTNASKLAATAGAQASQRIALAASAQANNAKVQTPDPGNAIAASTNGAASPASAPVPRTSQASKSAPGAKTADGAATAFDVSSQAAPQAAVPTSPAVTFSHNGKSDAGTAGDTADASTTATGILAAAGSPQPQANAAQPVAAAVVVNASMDTALSTTDTALTTGAAPISGHARSSSIVGGEVAVGKEDTTDGAAVKQASSGTPTEKTANAAPGPADDAAKNQASNATLVEPAKMQTADDAATQAQPKEPVSASANDLGAPTADLSTAPLAGATSDVSNVQEATGQAKADAAGLPDFGFSAANTASPTTAAAAPAATPSTAAVPIAGLAVAIAARAQGGSNQFDIRLDPPELGRIDVRLDVNSDGQATTHMTADRAETLQLLQSQQPQLERALEQAGLKTADNSLQFTLRDQSFAGQQNGSNPQSNGAAQLVVPDADLTPVAATQIYSRAGLGGGVDIRV